MEEKERFVVFRINEINRFLSEHIGQVAIEFDLLSILFNRFGITCLIILFRIVEITSRTGPQTIKIIESATGRIKFIRVSQVPLADQPSSVTELLEPVCHGDLLQIHAVGRGRGVGFMPEALLVPPRH